MPAWRFYQGLKGEWRWYELDSAGRILHSADQAFAELSACMKNAEAAGCARDSYQVHARAAETAQPGSQVPLPDAQPRAPN